jgi:hypothetical protein
VPNAFIVIVNMLIILLLGLAIYYDILRLVKRERRTNVYLGLWFRSVLMVVFITGSIVSNELVLVHAVSLLVLMFLSVLVHILLLRSI